MLLLFVIILFLLVIIVFTLKVVRVALLQQPSSAAIACRAGPAVIVLGSGGHTSEMLQWLRETLVVVHNPQQQTQEHESVPRRLVFIVSATDTHSELLARTFCVSNKIVACESQVDVRVIPRAREVGQAYWSSIFTTLKAILASLRLMHEVGAATIITNGPGVAVPIVVADILVTALGSTFPFSLLLPSRKPTPAKSDRAALLYVESFACVSHISLSGKILIWLAQVFVVQWPKLFKVMERKFGSQKIKYSGPFSMETSSINESDEVNTEALETANALVGHSSFRPLNNKNISNATNSKSAARCVVTVGSTKFDDLIHVVNCTEFDDILLGLGIEELLVQQGASNVMKNTDHVNPDDDDDNEQDVDRQRGALRRLSLRRKTVVNYKHGLGADIANASLVISHAGAGTILEAMKANVPTIVVPNGKLMANHQLELAIGLAKRGHLLCANPDQLLTLMKRLDVDWTKFVPMPALNGEAFCNVTKGFFHQEKQDEKKQEEEEEEEEVEDGDDFVAGNEKKKTK